MPHAFFIRGASPCEQWGPKKKKVPLSLPHCTTAPPHTHGLHLIPPRERVPASIIEIDGIDSLGVNGFCLQGEGDAL